MSTFSNTQPASGSSTRLEREAKLQATPDFTLPEEAVVVEGVRTGAAEEQRLETVYYDTSDLRLAQHEASLRLRKGEGWTLKLPLLADDQTLVRAEHVFPSAGDAVPAEALDLVHAMVRRQPMSPVAKLRTIRRRTPLLDPEGTVLADLVDDTVSVVENGRRLATFRELEVELVDGTPDKVLDAIVQALIKTGALPEPPQSKLQRALATRGVTLDQDATGTAERDGSLPALIRAALAASVQNLVRHDPGIRLGSDPEHVHQARVATRRLRSDLRAFRPFLDRDWTNTLRAELKWLGGALGAVRDAEVLFERLSSRVETLSMEDRDTAQHLLGRLKDGLADKRAELLIILRSDRYLDLLDVLADASKRPSYVPQAPEAESSAVRTLARKPWRKLQSAVKSLPAKPQDAELHAVRIRAKRCRYAAEAAAPVGGKAARRFAAACAGLQDVLGGHQDAVVAQAWLRQAAVQSSSREGFAAGILACREQQAAEVARAAWPKVWKGVRRKRLRRWMKA